MDKRGNGFANMCGASSINLTNRGHVYKRHMPLAVVAIVPVGGVPRQVQQSESCERRWMTISESGRAQGCGARAGEGFEGIDLGQVTMPFPFATSQYRSRKDSA